MTRFSLPKSFLFTLFLCFGAPDLTAREPEMIPPPLPNVIQPDSPDPNALLTGNAGVAFETILFGILRSASARRARQLGRQ